MSRDELNSVFSGQFEPRWTDQAVHSLAQATDSFQIGRVEAQLAAAIQEITPQDFRQYLASDVLPVQTILQERHRALEALTLARLALAIDSWHERLQACLSLSTSDRLLACGPGAVEDREVEASDLEQHLHGGDPPAISTGSSVRTVADVVATLREIALQPGQGLKPYLDNPELVEKLKDAFDRIPGSRSRLGGGQYNQARGARYLDIKADVAWLYHPLSVANHNYDAMGMSRIAIEAGSGFKPQSFYDPIPGDPNRTSYVVTLAPGMSIGGVEARGTDRVIFRMRRYATPGGEVPPATIRCNSVNLELPWRWREDEWPSLPFLARQYIQGGRRVFEPASDPALKALAQQYDRIIWNGLSALEDTGWNAGERAELAAVVAHQFEVLSEDALIFLELSGVPEDPYRLKETVSQKRVSCVGINQQELLQCTGSKPLAPNSVSAWPNPAQAPESLLQRRERGAHLARFLGTDVLVHGNDCSLYLTPSRSESRLRHMVSALLLGKVTVVASLMDRAGIELTLQQPTLAEKGFLALVQFAYDLARLHAPSPDDVHRITAQIVSDGYFIPVSKHDMSTVVVPTLWPEEVWRVNTAGAGDTVSAIVAAFLLPD